MDPKLVNFIVFAEKTNITPRLWALGPGAANYGPHGALWGPIGPYGAPWGPMGAQGAQFHPISNIPLLAPIGPLGPSVAIRGYPHTPDDPFGVSG